MGAMVLGAMMLAAAPAGAAVDCAQAGPAFMADYARELSAGDRAAIAARYSARGAYSNGDGPKTFDSHDAIVKRYAGPEWRKPDGFAWTDLSYEQIGRDACLVTGGFTWTAGQRSAGFAYTAVLRSEARALKIIVEHESMLPIGRR